MSWRESTNQRVLSTAVSRLKRAVEAAYYQCQDDLAGELHDDLVAAEWRLRRLMDRARQEMAGRQ